MKWGIMVASERVELSKDKSIQNFQETKLKCFERVFEFQVKLHNRIVEKIALVHGWSCGFEETGTQRDKACQSTLKIY